MNIFHQTKLSRLLPYLLPIGAFFVPIYIQMFTLSWIVFLSILILFYPTQFIHTVFSIKHTSSSTKTLWILFITYYLMHIIGMIWTTNISNGLFDIQVKTSLFFVPFVIYVYHKLYSIKDVLYAFFYGCITASIITIVHFIYQHIVHHQNMLYTSFSIFHHPSYFAMYLLSAIAILWSPFTYPLSLKSTHKIIATCLFTINIILSVSKSGILAMILFFIFFFVLHIKNIKHLTITLVATILMTLLIVQIIPHSIRQIIFERFQTTFSFITNEQKNNIDAVYIESNSIRYFAWKIAWDLSTQSPLLGYGTGDDADVLIAAYTQHHLYIMAEKKLNAHNQFLQDAVKVGYSVVLILLLIFLFSILYASFLSIKIFYVMMFFHFLVESMLETQGGAIFFPMIIFTLHLAEDGFIFVPSDKTSMQLR